MEDDENTSNLETESDLDLDDFESIPKFNEHQNDRNSLSDQDNKKITNFQTQIYQVEKNISDFETKIAQLKSQKNEHKIKITKITNDLLLCNWLNYLDSYTQNDVWYLVENKGWNSSLDDTFWKIDAKFTYFVEAKHHKFTCYDNLDFMVAEIRGLDKNSVKQEERLEIKYANISKDLWSDPYAVGDKFLDKVVNKNEFFRDCDDHGIITIYGDVHIDVILIKRRHPSFFNFNFVIYEYVDETDGRYGKVYHGYELVDKELWKDLKFNKSQYGYETDLMNIDIDTKSEIIDNTILIRFIDLKIKEIYRSREDVSFFARKYRNEKIGIQWFETVKDIQQRELDDNHQLKLKQLTIDKLFTTIV
jgi:hypothetical protein